MKIWQSHLSMQAVPLDGSIFWLLLRSHQLEAQDHIKINKCVHVLEKSDLKECKTNLEYSEVKFEANR